jgi:hypothetical protein
MIFLYDYYCSFMYSRVSFSILKQSIYTSFYINYHILTIYYKIKLVVMVGMLYKLPINSNSIIV